MSESPERVAAAALAKVPPDLRQYTSDRLLLAVERGPILGVEPLIGFLGLHFGDPGPAIDAARLRPETANALRQLVAALQTWRQAPTIDHRIYELEEYGLPATPDDLESWLAPR